MRAGTREAILAAAATVLSEEGPAALTIRRVAQAVNASTKVIYTSFGGKDGLLDALYLHSFTGLEREMLSARTAAAAPADCLHAVCLAYRAYALAEPAFYNVMFGDLGRAWQPPHESRLQARETFRILREAIEVSLPPHRLPEAIPTTRLLWAAMHGVVSLEMRGLLAEEAADCVLLFEDAVRAVCLAHGIDAVP